MNTFVGVVFHWMVDLSNPRSLASRYRRRRVTSLLKAFKPHAGSLVLEIGSFGSYFRQVWPYPESVIGLDLVWSDELRQRKGLALLADVRALPFKNNSMDIICNSVLEHVGPFPEQERAAAEIVRSARSYFVQIPHKYFPIDPHYFTIPFFQFLPTSWQRRVCRHIGVGYLARGDFLEIHYLTERQLSTLFPDASIVREKSLGLTKSLYAVRSVSGLENSVSEERQHSSVAES